jgi:hypothetical protein
MKISSSHLENPLHEFVGDVLEHLDTNLRSELDPLPLQRAASDCALVIIHTAIVAR